MTVWALIFNSSSLWNLIKTLLSLPKFKTTKFALSIFEILLRIFSRSAFCSYFISIETPPVKSRPRFNPLPSNEINVINIKPAESIMPILLNLMNGIFIKLLTPQHIYNHK